MVSVINEKLNSNYDSERSNALVAGAGVGVIVGATAAKSQNKNKQNPEHSHSQDLVDQTDTLTHDLLDPISGGVD